MNNGIKILFMCYGITFVAVQTFIILIFRIVDLHYDRFTTPISDDFLNESGNRAMMKKSNGR